MADIQSNINVNIDTSEALASIKVLQRQISAFYTSMARSGAAANAAVSNMQSNLINTINQTGKFSASVKTVASSTEAFTTSLEKNKFSLGQYFRYAAGASKTFGKSFLTEMQTIDKVARERVKTLQTQYISMGRDASGALKAIAVRPLTLDLKDLGTQTAIAAQKQQILNQLLKQGSTNLLNFGKNTQWAGRQLMVGFTIPLSMVGTAAAKTFMKMEEQAIKFKRVYGDSMTPTAETDAMIKQIRDLATEFTKYGVAAEKTMELAATAAAAGKQGADLTGQVREANRLAVLGQVEQQDALNTTISITNAFGTATEELAKKINFLNAVENQTVTSIEDLTVAVPKAGPVIKQLGGDVEDLAFFLTAMREGGINASEGANALKSGLAALINPTGKAAEMLAGFGINVKNIVESNKGDVKGLVLDFASALDTLDPLSRARAIEQLFGKFQFSRLSTLFQNVIKDGTQASRVLDLTTQSSSQLAALASKELGTVAASSMFKFQKSVEELKIALAPIGEIFLKLVTPIIEFGTKVLENFNKLDSGAKNFIVGLVAVVGGLGPVLLMTFGLLANGVANIIKGFMLVRKVFTGSAQETKFLGDETEYMTQQQLEATGVAASLEQVHQRLEQRFTSEATAVNALSQALERAVRAQVAFQGTGGAGRPATPKKYAKGVVSVPGPKGAGDIVPAMLAPGEAVIPSKQAQKYAALIQGIVADNIPGYEFSNVDISDAGRPTQARKRGKRGGGQSLVIRGGADQAHFDATEYRTMTIREIHEYVESLSRELSTAAETMLQRLADESGQGLDTVVRVWSDKVIMLEGELHKLFTSNAGEKKDPVAVSEVKRVLSEQGKGTYAKTRDTLVSQGVSESDANEQIGLVEQEVSRRLDALGDEAVITSEEFSKLVESAHKAVGELTRKVNEAESDLERAYATMSETRTFLGKDRNNKPTRIDIFAGEPGYQNKKVAAQTRESAHELSGGSILQNRGMKVTQDIEDAIGKSEQEILEAWAGIPSRMQDELAKIRTNATAFADKFREILAAMGTSFETALTESLTQAGLNVTTSIGDGMDQAIQRNSPPQEAIEIGRDYGFALNGALREIIPKVKVSGEAFGIAATTGMTTISPAMMQHFKDTGIRIVQPYLDAQGELIPIAIQRVEVLDEEAIAARRAADAIREHNLALAEEATQEIISSDAVQAGTSAEIAEDMQDLGRTIPHVETGFSKFGSTLRNGSFMLTSLAAAGTMAGGTIGELSTGIMQFSGIIFAVTTLMDMLSAAQARQAQAVNANTLAQATAAKTGFLASLMSSPGKTAAGGAGFLATARAQMTTTKGMTGFSNIIKTVGANLLTFGRVALSFVPVIGWVALGITALSVALKLIQDANARARKEIFGLADAVRMSADKINAAGNAIGKEKFVSSFDTVGTAMSPTATQESLSLTEQFLQDEQFLEKFKSTTDDMINATQKDLETIQNSIALSFASIGWSEEEINSLITALQTTANRTDVKFDFKSIDVSSKDPNTFKSLVSDFAKKADEALSKPQTKATQNTAIGNAEALQQAFYSLNDAVKTGQIDVDGYNQRIAMLTSVVSESTNATKLAGQMMTSFTTNLINSSDEGKKKFGAMLELKPIMGFSGQLSVMQGISSGAIQNVLELGDAIDYLNIIARAASGENIAPALLAEANAYIDAMNKRVAAIAEANAKAFKASQTETGGAKSVFQIATEQLANNIDEINKATTAYGRLTRAGLSAADAFRIAKDPALAAALATTKVGTAKWKELILLTKQYSAELKNSKLNDVLANLKIDNQTMSSFGNLSKYLQQMGLSGEDIQAVINDPELAESLMYATGEGEKGFAKIKEYIAYILKNKEIRISILPLEDQFKERMQKVSDWFSNERNALEIQLKIDTKADQDIARMAQQQIDTLNFQADDFEAGLTRLEDGEEAINEKYDNRIESLDKIISANNRIADQNKEELNIFQMVARGDISGAAAGIAQLQQQKTKNALEAKKESLETQRKNELESMTVEVMVNGQKVMMTRNDIEANLKNIKQQIFEIEEKTLEPAQRRIDILTSTKENLDASLTVLGLTEDEWLKISNNIDLSKTRTTAYLKELEKALDIAKQIPGALAGTSKSGQEIIGEEDPVVETDFGKNEDLRKIQNRTPGGTPAKTDGRTQEEKVADYQAGKEKERYKSLYGDQPLFSPTRREIENYQGEVKKLMEKNFLTEWEKNDNAKAINRYETKYGIIDLKSKKRWDNPSVPFLYKASGGYISGPGTGTSDSIPALLSNGEYVIRANAVKALGTDTLDRMNHADKNRFADGGFVDRRDTAMANRGAAQPKPKPKSSSNPIVSMAAEAFKSFSDPLHNIKTSVESMVGSGTKVASGQGDALDYLNLASILPLGKPLAAISKFAKPVMDKIKYAVNPEGSRESNLVGLTRLITGNRRGVFGSSGPDFYEKGAIRNFIRSNPNVGVRMPEENLIDLINSKDKRYKSIFESGRSNLNDSIADRELVESKIFGLSQGLEHSKRPVYGFMYNAEKPQLGNKMRRESLFTKLTGKPESMDSRRSVKSRLNYSMFTATNNKDLDRYGNATLVLKKKNIKDRTTFTYGDSYNNRQDRWPTPAPMGTMSSQAIKKSYNSRVRKEFIETQTMGGFTLNDVKKIIATDPKTIAMLQDALKAQNINIPVGLPELTKFQKLREILFPKRYKPIEKPDTTPIDYSKYEDDLPFADGGLVDRRDLAMANRNKSKPKKKIKFGLEEIASGLTNPVIQGAAYGTDVLGGMDIANSLINIGTGKGGFLDYLSAASILPIGKPAAAISKGAKALGGTADAFKVYKNPSRSDFKFNSYEAQGMTPGGIRKIDGVPHYVKRPFSTAEATGEVIASELYAAMGNTGARLNMFGRNTIGSKFIPDLKSSSELDLGEWVSSQGNKKVAGTQLITAMKEYLERDVPFNALIGNTDAHGGNIMFNPKSGKFVNLDLGMSVLSGYRGRDTFGSIAMDDMQRIKDDVIGGLEQYLSKSDIEKLLKQHGIGTSKSPLVLSGHDVTPTINKMASLMGFDLKDPNALKKITAQDNQFIKNILATNPELASMLDLTGKAGGRAGFASKATLSESIQELYRNLLEAQKNPFTFYADGGLVGRPGGWSTSYGTAANEAKAKAARDKLFKQGGSQGFEAGIQGMMSDFGKNDVVKGFGSFLNDKDNFFAMRTRNALGTLSLPAELMGATAKTITTATGQASKGKMFEAMGTLIRGSMGGNFIDALNNAYSGVADPTKQKSSLFQQASEQVIKNKTFGTGNAESDAWARIVGGALNFVGDPLSYLGVGIAARGLRASASAATSSAKIGQYSSSLKNVGKAAGFAPGLLGLPNLSDVQNIKSLFTSGKATGTTSSIAKTDALDPFEDSPISNLDSPTFSGISASQIQQKVSEAVNPETVVLDEAIQELLKNGSLANLTSFKSPSTGGFKILPEDLGTDIKSLIQGLPTDVVVGKQELGVYSDRIGRVIESALKNAAMRELTIFQKVPKKRIVDILKERKLLHQFHPEFAKKGIDPRGMFANSRVPGTGGFAYNFRTRAESSMFNVPLTEDVVRPVYGFAALSPHTPLDTRQFGFRTFSPFGSNKTLSEWDSNGLDLSALGNVPPVIAREFTQKFRNMANALSTPVDDIKGLSNYGGITLEYKDSIKEFTTGTIGDTIYSSEALPMPFAKNTREFLERNGYPNTKVHDDIGTQERYSTIGQAARYVEAQILQNYKTTNALDHLKAIHVDDISSTLLKELVSVRDDMYPGVAIIDRLTGNKFKDGGMVKPKFFAKGGMVMPQFFSKGGDVVPAMLTPGEFVVNKHAVEDYGVNNLRAINSGTAPGNSVYNGYNINVNVKSNSNPDQIANAVMTQIRQVNAQQVRGNRF